MTAPIPRGVNGSTVVGQYSTVWQRGHFDTARRSDHKHDGFKPYSVPERSGDIPFPVAGLDGGFGRRGLHLSITLKLR